MSTNQELSEAGWVPHEDGTFVATIGNVFERRRDTLVEIALLTDERQRNLSGNLHGGAIMILMDRVIGINCREAVQGQIFTGTITVNFLRPVRIGEFLTLSCNLRKVGRGVVFADAQAFVGDRLVATASATCIKPGAGLSD